MDNKKIGAEMLRLRCLLKIPQKNVAGFMDLSATYIGELERGTRTWNEEKITAYKKAIGAA